MCKEYGELSTKFYEITKPVGYSIEGDIEYYLEKLEGTAGRILEAGVGTGRMLIPLSKKGLDVDGVDSSPEMLKQCKANLQKHGTRADLYKQDLVELSLPERYEAIIMPAGSFCLLDRKRAQETLFRFYNHLEEKGKIIIDLEMPIDFKEGELSISQIELPDNYEILLSSHSKKIDWLEQKVTYLNEYKLTKNRQLIRTEKSDFILYWYGIEEFEMKLEQIGFRDISYEIAYGKAEQGAITFIAFK
ncbi:MAG: methyltransferase domain-containing protein [Tissierellia bacterium]|nr:methyltransferase domain-containing protein [Tissierellia bacterium]